MAKKDMGSVGQELRDIWRKNKAEQDAQKAQRKAAKAMEGTPGERARGFLSRWLKRLFYTAFVLMATYLVVMVCTLSIPLFLSIIVSSLEYTLSNIAEIMLTGFCGIFFVLWCFAGSFFVVRAFWKIYIKAIRTTMKKKPEEQA